MSDYNNLSTLWFTDIRSKEDQEQFIQYLSSQSDNRCLVRLKHIISNRRASLENSERNPEIYRDNSWAYLQAHNNGARQALKLIEDLLNFVN